MAPGALGELHGRFRLSFTIYARQDEAGWICCCKVAHIVQFYRCSPMCGRDVYKRQAQASVMVVHPLPYHAVVGLGHSALHVADDPDAASRDGDVHQKGMRCV